MKEILCFAAGFALAAIIMIILNRKAIRAARKKRKQEVQKDPEKKIQATKIIVFSINWSLITPPLSWLYGL